ncbi:DUF21 domain-containing protein [Morus notabilis]|uniref:DUF21 domain-containing protein n=1 Tax=Morus notabilis TaxID=981085 RepID=W9RVI7_9ROSA|nr:DUF21 domain-containing protein [Morus notabilis]
MAIEYSCCETGFFIRIVIIIALVLFAGLMSGLTLGLMSLSLVDLEVLAKSGTPTDSSHAEKILPVVRKQHLLLCTLLICNAAAMEIIPQAVCSRYGLAVGAAVAPFVRVLVCICFPVAYPISKLLDFLLGKGHDALFRRDELKTLVDLHGNEAGKGGELTRDETMIIAGALELTEKTASDAMTPISETFAVDVNAKLDRNLKKVILEKGHSRVPVYHEQPRNIIGLVLVKNLLTIHPDDEVPVKRVAIRKIPRVPETMPLYDILNEFQKGHSHMAVVVRQKNDMDKPATATNLDDGSEVRDVRVDIHGEGHPHERTLKADRSLKKLRGLSKEAKLNRSSKGKKWSKDFESDFLHIDEEPLPKLNEEGEAIGLITLEDVIEELLQEEIYDETDYHNENHHS